MSRSTFSERVLLNEDRFTDFEEELTRFALAHPQEVSATTIKGLAERFYVSPNSIMRLARKLGYEGFSDMRISLAHEMGQGPTEAVPTTEALVRKTFELCCREDRQRKASAMMRSAERVAIFAVGETAYAAHAFARVFEAFDNKTEFVTYENQVRHEIARGRGLLLFAISMSGETPQVVNVAREAKERGVPVLSMTDLSHNSLVRNATLSLFCCSPQEHVDGINITDLTPLFAAMMSFERCYLGSLGVLPAGPDGAGRTAPPATGSRS